MIGCVVAGLVDVLADAVLSAVELGDDPLLDVPAEVVTGDVEAAVPADRAPLQPVASTPAALLPPRRPGGFDGEGPCGAIPPGD